jgi:hypothetical protein
MRVRVPLEKVPVGVWRQAARHLESIRAMPLGAGAGAATIAPEACPLYRPDVKGIAYWEFELVGLRRPRPQPGPKGAAKDPRVGTGTGFIVLAAGRHDVPVPHWSLDRNPPSRALEARLAKPGAVSPVARLYKLDALCYVAEAEGGKYLGHLGQFPPLTQFPAAAQKLQSYPGSARYAPPGASKNDARPPKLVATIGGRKPPNAKMLHWETWGKAKQGYTKAFQKQLQAQAARAAARWQLEDLLTKFGEGIHAGQTLVVPLLKPGKAAIAGDGVKLVRMAPLDRQVPAVQLTALDSDTKGEVHFTLELSYVDGSTESLPYFVVPTGTPSDRHPPIPPGPIRPVPPVVRGGKRGKG